MKIKSSFVDYYDRVQGMSGGGDPKVFYHRKPIEKTSVDYKLLPFRGDTPLADIWRSPRRKKSDFELLKEKYNLHNNWHEREMIIVVAARAFTVYERVFSTYPESYWHKVGPKWHPLFDSQALKEEILSFEIPTFQLLPRYKKFEDGEPCLPLVREVGAPVFALVGDRLKAEIPKLKDFGFPRIMEAEQMYQEIAYCITSLIPVNPDAMPPTQRSDKEKIQSHGFDVKRSFRSTMK